MVQQPAASSWVGGEVIFGDFRFNSLERRLSGPGGAAALSARACDLLVALLRRPGELVTKDQLMRELWPGTIVEDNNLHVHVSALRKVLGAGVIQTVSGRGYRYVGGTPVSGAPAGTAPPQGAGPSGSGALHPGGNLTTFLPALIGRDADLVELCALSRQARLVSVVGPGGIGKTRLALAAGESLGPEFPDGTWLVDFAPVPDPALAPGTIAKALGIVLRSGLPPLEQVVTEMKGRRFLLILDNCEHLVSAIADLAGSLLAAAPHAHILATSQEPLGATGENLFRLSPLDLPGENDRSVAGIGAAGAVKFFVDRLCALDRHFRLEDANAPLVAEICQRLDGIPLALEMASGQAASLGLSGLRSAIEARFELPAASRRSALVRHRTLGATLDWSHGLLDPLQQALFRRLGVFPASFTAESVRQIASGEPLDPAMVIRGLADLVERSLVIREGSGNARFRLLETMRAYASGKLDAAGETADLRDRHAAFFLERLEQGIRDWNSVPDRIWLETYGADLDDVRAAMSWAETRRDPRMQIRLAGSFYRLWLESGMVEEAMAVAERALERLPAGGDMETEARFRLAFGELASTLGSQLLALRITGPAVPLFRKLGKKTGLCAALHRAGFAHACLQQHEDARRCYAEAAQVIADHPPSKLMARLRMAQGLNLLSLGEDERAYRVCDEALRIHREAGDDRGYLKSVMYLAEVSFHSGHLDRAVSLGEELRIELAQTRVRLDLGAAVSNLATYHLMAGDITLGQRFLGQSWEILSQSSGSWRWCCFQNAALALALTGEHAGAARVTGYVDRCYEASGVFRQLTEQMARGRIMSILTREVPEPDLARLLAEGGGWTDEFADRAVRFPPDPPPAGG